MLPLHWLLRCLLGHSDITKFRPWSTVATGNNLDRAERIPELAQMTGTVDVFWSTFRHFGTHFAESFCMAKSSWMMDATCSHELPSCSAIDLAKIRQSSKISSWICSIFSGVVTVLGRPGRGASQVEKSPRLNWATHFLTVAYDGACSPNVCQNGVNFPSAPCLAGKKKLDESSCHHVVEIACIAWHASFLPLWQEKTCNSAHERTCLSNTIDFFLRHREVGRAKDQHPLV